MHLQLVYILVCIEINSLKNLVCVFATLYRLADLHKPIEEICQIIFAVQLIFGHSNRSVMHQFLCLQSILGKQNQQELGQGDLVLICL